MKKLLTLLILLAFALQAEAKKSKNKFVEIITSMGTIKVELFADVPKHSENFLKLVEEKFYDSVLFHRVIPQFMIQGGDPLSKTAAEGQALGNGEHGDRIPAEFMLPKYYHRQGALAAARDMNPEKASSGCQFYIVVGRTFTDEQLDQFEKNANTKYSEEARTIYKTIGGTPHLDGSYTVYGQVVAGQDVVNAISSVERAPGDRPLIDVRVISMRVVKK